MDFADALGALTSGDKIARAGWDTSHAHLELDDGVIVLVTNIEDDNRPWVTGSADLLADDWEVVSDAPR